MQTIFPAYMIVRGLLILLLLAGVYFFKGFILPVLAALIIGFASWPFYTKLVRRCGGRTALSATIALLMVIGVLVIPLSMAMSYAINEAVAFIDWLLKANRAGMSAPGWIKALPLAGERLAEYWQEYLSQPNALGEWVRQISGQHLGDIYAMIRSAAGNVFRLALILLFMLITLFFIYKDGHRIAAQLDLVGERILPARWKRFSRVIPTTVSATVTGMGVIALGEGVVLGIAYWIAGVPSPVLLGAATGFMALIPGGAPLSFTLVSLYLVGSGRPMAGLALFAWGTIELFIVDKTLRPRLVGGPVKLPFLPTFFGLIGGVQTMGLVGLFVGPVLMALLVAVWREWLRAATDDSAPQTVPLLPADAEILPAAPAKDSQT